VDGMDGIVLVHPPDAKVEGQNLLQDPASKNVMALLIEKAKTERTGWIEYMWPKPGESTPSKKISYIRKVKMPDGREIIVGAGMYAKND
jgi:cytochrome c